MSYSYQPRSGLPRQAAFPLTVEEEARALFDLLPRHACYVEPFGNDRWRVLGRRARGVEVVNDWYGPGVMNLLHFMRYAPVPLLAALRASPWSSCEEPPLVERARLCFEGLMAAWDTFHPRPGPPLCGIASVEAMRERFRPPYRRMLTVMWEHLDWRDCIERFDRPGAMQVIEPPWPVEEWDLYAALAFRLARAACRWVVCVRGESRLADLFRPLARSSSSPGGWREDCLLFMNFTPEGGGLAARAGWFSP